ncbi:hypothetical protein BZA77DRAFT_356889 [Pyronema omphalodes]|nr:hypothetical protein BZA77DRAFT_356889 [Pyronema omphalodes]
MAPLSLINGPTTPEKDRIPSFETLLDQITPSDASAYIILRDQFQVLVRSLIKRHNPFNNPEYDAHDGFKIQDMMMQCRKLYPESKARSDHQEEHAENQANHAYASIISGFGRLGNLVRYAYVGDTHFAGGKQIDKNMCRQYMTWMGFGPAEVEECWRVVEEKRSKKSMVVNMATE